MQGVLAVPPVRWFEAGCESLGAPFYVMDFVEGDVPLPVMRADGTPPLQDAAEREGLARDLTRNLAQQHRFDWRSSAMTSFAAPSGCRDAAFLSALPRLPDL